MQGKIPCDECASYCRDHSPKVFFLTPVILHLFKYTIANAFRECGRLSSGAKVQICGARCVFAESNGVSNRRVAEHEETTIPLLSCVSLTYNLI